ncbi:hypothetical protein HDV00_006581 [Rhizophlyctis rosea]|nr:hypothetical protein HDV00_006581 [Rhizophlyctis rosea]
MSAANNELLSMSLDDIIDKNQTGRRGRRSGGGGAVRNNRRGPRSTPYGSGSSPQKRTAASSTRAPVADKIVVSNLGKSVTERDVMELFNHVGPVRNAFLSFDSQGKSKGVATVLFKNHGDAAKAVREYHNRTLDGRAMKIELIFSADAVDSLAPVGGAGRSGGGRPSGDRRPGGRGGRGGRGRRGPPRERRPPADQKSLDAEMDAYMNDANMTDAQPLTNGNGINTALANAI